MPSAIAARRWRSWCGECNNGIEAEGSVAGRSSLPTAHASPQFKTLPPLSLYVHIPWCARKCPYCDFNSHEARGELPEQAYVAALLADLELALPDVWGRAVNTVFIGGGTPRLPMAADAEITLEANPGTVEAEKFTGFRSAGINRVSLGIQSFNDAHLRALGRIHDAAEAWRAAELALRVFDNVNLDLMYGLPGQTPDQAAADIAQGLSLGPQHLSAYHLTIEPNTLFHHRPPALPDDDTSALMQDAVEAQLAAAGYGHYETSAFARPGRQCRHNLNYWLFGDYLGIGAGAHEKISFKNNILRRSRVRQPKAYLAQAGTQGQFGEQRGLSPAELPGEFMMNALRLNQGFDLDLYPERIGCDSTPLLARLDAAEARGLIVRDHRRVTPSALGRRFLNDLIAMFLD
jgi:putative oxygen-independent coproporphyrinogen III oxidase